MIDMFLMEYFLMDTSLRERKRINTEGFYEKHSQNQRKNEKLFDNK